MNEGVYRALLVGNSTFPKDPHNLPELKGPSNDLAWLSAALVHPASGLFAKRNVRVVAEKTKREITQAVERFYRSAGSEDTLLLYYSGHGQTDETDDLFLCARDTSTDLLVSTGISDAEVDGMMKRSNARRFVVILDCCHSGAFKSGGLPPRLKGTGRFLLTSSRRGENSRDAKHPDEPSDFTRHLVEALRTGGNRGGDGYVSVNEVYDQVLQTLRRETKQIPQRQFDKTIGDIALARSVAAAKSPRPNRARQSAPRARPRPVLTVSPSEIVIPDAGGDEELPVEIIEVSNDGDGKLDWTAMSEADWIEITKHDTYCELRLRPKRPGVNRANVRIRDAGRGGASTVRIVVKVRPADEAPSIEVTPTELDFGVLPRSSDSPLQTLLLKTTGSGIDAVASSDASWLTIEQKEDIVNVSVDTSKAKALSGHVVVRSSAGDRVVPVRAIVERGPVLTVRPQTIDFGRTTHGTVAEATVKVANGGSGELQWKYRKKGAFFGIKRAGNSLTVTLTAPAGNHVGSIAITSNAGSATVEVLAHVAAKPRPRSGKKRQPRNRKTAEQRKPTGIDFDLVRRHLQNSDRVFKESAAPDQDRIVLQKEHQVFRHFGEPQQLVCAVWVPEVAKGWTLKPTTEASFLPIRPTLYQVWAFVRRMPSSLILVDQKGLLSSTGEKKSEMGEFKRTWILLLQDFFGVDRVRLNTPQSFGHGGYCTDIFQVKAKSGRASLRLSEESADALEAGLREIGINVTVRGV